MQELRILKKQAGWENLFVTSVWGEKNPLRVMLFTHRHLRGTAVTTVT